MHLLNRHQQYRRVSAHRHTLTFISNAKTFPAKMRSYLCTIFAVIWIKVKYHGIQWVKMCWANHIHCKFQTKTFQTKTKRVRHSEARHWCRTWLIYGFSGYFSFLFFPPCILVNSSEIVHWISYQKHYLCWRLTTPYQKSHKFWTNQLMWLTITGK